MPEPSADRVREFASLAGLSQVERAAEGIECEVYKAISPAHGPVALRIPKQRIYQNANDPNTSAEDLLKQELRIYGLLHGGPVPVPRPGVFLETKDGYPAMFSEFVEDDGSKASPTEMGRVAALIHSKEVPGDWETGLVAQETQSALTTIVQRVIRRMDEFAKEVPQASSWAPTKAILDPIARGLERLPSCLLHMDFRDVNLRVRDGKIVAVLDWTNAMFGPAVIDLYRMVELERPGDEFMEAYGAVLSIPAVTQREETFLRLDAALMIALVFMSEAPDPERSKVCIKRVEELCRALTESV